MGVVVVGIADVVQADAVDVLLHGGSHSRIAENGRAAQVLLLGAQPQGPGLGRSACVGTRIGMERRLIVGAEHVAPGFGFARDPDADGRFARQPPGEQLGGLGVGGIDRRSHGILGHGETDGALGRLGRIDFARHHAEIDDARQGIGHALSGTSGRDVDPHSGMELLEFGGPLHRKRIERKRTRERQFAAQFALGGLSSAAAGGHAERRRCGEQGGKGTEKSFHRIVIHLHERE